MSAFELLQKTIASTLKVTPEKITETTSDQNLAAWDSLGHVNLIMALEQTYDLVIEVEDFSRLNSVASITRYLKDCGKIDN
jgi:acyl carrier protein